MYIISLQALYLFFGWMASTSELTLSSTETIVLALCATLLYEIEILTIFGQRYELYHNYVSYTRISFFYSPPSWHLISECQRMSYMVSDCRAVQQIK